MPESRSVYHDLRRVIDVAPVVDTHEHIRPLADLKASMNTTSLIRESYLVRCLRASDGSGNGEGTTFDVSLDTDCWETVAWVLDRVRFTGYYHWLIRGLQELYDLPNPQLTPDTWEYLSAELHRRYQDPTWQGQVLDRARIIASIWDPFWCAGTSTTPEPRLLPSLRINSSLVAFHPNASDFERSNLVRDWAPHYDVSVATLADLEALIVRVIEANIAAGCRSLKSAIAYDRTLEIGPASRAAAGRVFGTAPEHVSPADRKLFGDYIVRFYLDQARARGLVFQVHTGIGRLGGSNPLLLAPLLEEYPDVVFDLFHGGYPWVHHVAALAHNYPNVRLNMTWLPQLSTELTVGCLKEWLQVMLQADRISWGGDCSTVEEAYGSLLAARHAVARALAELVEDGFFDMETAIVAAHSLLSIGGARIYRV